MVGLTRAVVFPLLNNSLMVRNDVATRQLFAQRKKINSDDDAARRIGRLLSTLIWGGSKKGKKKHTKTSNSATRGSGVLFGKMFTVEQKQTHIHTRFCIYFLYFLRFFFGQHLGQVRHTAVCIFQVEKKVTLQFHMRSNRNGITKCIHICIYGLWVPSRRLIGIAQQYLIATTLASAQYWSFCGQFYING